MRSRLYLALAAAAALWIAPATASPAPPGVRKLHVAGGAVHAAVGASNKQVRLTLDPDLQRAAERLLARSGAPEGAIVASDVRTGRILVWASRGKRDYVATPLAPSASLFKIVTAAALLEAGKVNVATPVCYTGGMSAITARDLQGRGATCTVFGEALGRSINGVFARLAGQHLTAADLRRKARDLGFDGEVPIDVPVAPSAARIPDDALGLARAGAGFWSGRLSPLGALFAMQTIANDGERVRLSLLAPPGAHAGGDAAAPAPRSTDGRGLRPEVARTLRSMLEVTTRRGTCAKAFRKPDGTRALGTMPVAAKTGTLVGGSPARMFSWFASFAPSDRPEIAVSVMLANDIAWRTKANLVGRELLEIYFGRRRPGPVARRR
ncbi:MULTISPECIES: penicillin-binding transpeptidase domain-containing protein [Sorangium]|uniref:Penicillin-binding protein n=1 Tax=Sorangium cellulosum TaxID=56 RepID=A0A4V0NGP9_SORCE|nr:MULTISPECIES: penicillin-binding transpeptidase domain-containing protein [Sorangium]AUX33932.1 penicillin-binding protein [Sorangium cellulosum]WCQ93241.1 Penicillin-binding protein PbpB [Sorangium sp. Soce836]